MFLPTLFDKSFLQSLSLDESVWFDHFFQANICPLFYVETLADLKKSGKSTRTPEDEVRVIADKFPERQGIPSMHHATLCLKELLGTNIPLKGQIVVEYGRPVRSGKTSGVVLDDLSAALAFSRWQKKEFYDLEWKYAALWRESLSGIKLPPRPELFRMLGIEGESCGTLGEAQKMAEMIVSSKDKKFDKLQLALLFLGIDARYHTEIMRLWSISNYRQITEYAPYSAYVFMVELFFQIALEANLISRDRPSNRVDIAYLFYLPFCRLFVSSDRLHQKCAPLFLKTDQEFIWGVDLKNGLHSIDEHYKKLPHDVKLQGLSKFATNPPTEGDFFVSKIYDRHLPGWSAEKNTAVTSENSRDTEILSRIKKLTTARRLQGDEIDFDVQTPDATIIKRQIRKKKGSWYQLPKDLQHEK